MGVNANTDFIHGKQQKVKEILVISLQDILTEQRLDYRTERCSGNHFTHKNSTESTIFQNLLDFKETGIVSRNQERK